MTRVPPVTPDNSRQSGNDDELARLQAWRDYLLAKIDHEERASTTPMSTMPMSLRIVILGLIAAFGAVLLAGIWTGQIEGAFIIWTVLIGGVLMFIGSREVRLFGSRFLIGEFAVFILQGVNGYPPMWLIGRPDLRDQLARCEAQISRLREHRP